MDEAGLIKATVKLEQFVSGALDGEIKSMLTGKAILAGICMAVPLWGLETIVYGFCLWSAYSRISDISGVPFRAHFWRNLFGGIGVNVIVTAILGFALDFIPLLGWIGSFAVGFASLYVSAMGYVKMLKAIHGDKAKSDLNFSQGIQYMKQDTSSFNSTLQKSIDQGKKIDNFFNS